MCTLPPAYKHTYNLRHILIFHFYPRYMSTCSCFMYVEASVVQWQRAGLLANRSNDRSCSRGMIHNQFPFIRPGCLRPSTALTVQNRGLKHPLFLLQSAIWRTTGLYFCPIVSLYKPLHKALFLDILSITYMLIIDNHIFFFNQLTDR